MENKNFNQNYETKDAINMLKLFKRLNGVNGTFTYKVKRYKNDDNSISKKYYGIITIPVTKNIDSVNKKLEKYNSTYQKDKIFLSDSEIEGIKILNGIISVKDYIKIGFISLKLFNKMMDIFLDDE